ncbi:MAG: spore coat protein CotJB [Bacillota bacterium]|nr:spore coat protein CotJB [Bacillota bacterium]
MNGARSRLELLRRIQALEFTAIDLNLFLDTHPRERRALEDYNRVVRELAAAKREYEEAYGPLVNFGHAPSPDGWRWIDEPWPWEVEN